MIRGYRGIWGSPTEFVGEKWHQSPLLAIRSLRPLQPRQPLPVVCAIHLSPFAPLRCAGVSDRWPAPTKAARPGRIQTGNIGAARPWETGSWQGRGGWVRPKAPEQGPTKNCLRSKFSDPPSVGSLRRIGAAPKGAGSHTPRPCQRRVPGDENPPHETRQSRTSTLPGIAR
jgi:hypothetical protein